MGIGSAIRKARMNSGLSQKELGHKLGVSQALVSQWENDNIIPEKDTAREIESILGPLSGRAAEELEAASVAPFGVWLSKARTEHQWTPAQLGEKAGVSVPTIYNIESGRVKYPNQSTIKRLEKALGETLDRDIQEQMGAEASIAGLGALEDFDPHSPEDSPEGPGVYVIYDVSNRPIYVGESKDVKRRINEHRDKFWFRSPITHSASYVRISDKNLRRQVEAVLIKFLKNNAVINQQQVDREV